MSVLGGRKNRLDPRLAFNQICALQFMTPARGCLFKSIVDPDARTGAIVEYTHINPEAAFVPDRLRRNFDTVAEFRTLTAAIKESNHNNGGTYCPRDTYKL